MRSVLLLALLAACDDSRDVVGPFTGEARRFVVDSIRLPMTNNETREFGGDLNGDDTIDNQLGMVAVQLLNNHDLTTHGDGIINAGLITSSVIVTADDLTTDATVSVLYKQSDDDTTGIVVGGTLTDGIFEPNRTAWTQVPGEATIDLPALIDADPTTIRVHGLEIELVADGADGFDAELHGVVDDPAEVLFASVQQMVSERPYDHIVLMGWCDGNHDGALTREEFVNCNLVRSLLAPDITFRGKRAISVGFRAHLKPCPSGSCDMPRVSCFNRVLDGAEVHLDCGGGCRGCAEGATCTAASDCESLDCTANQCGPPSCSNGVRDGAESDTDCGHVCTTKCYIGQRCLQDADCAPLATCGPPCTGPWCADYGEDTCR